MNRLALLLSACLLLAASVHAAPENIVVRDINPDAEHPRNSEGSFVTLKSGRILFYYTQFYGGARDNSPARVVSIHSDDAGRTWSNPAIIIENAGEENVMSVSLLRLQSGKIALFYIIKNSWLDCRPVLRLSSDEAESWSEPAQVIPAPGYFVLNNDRVIQLKSGRLLVPVAFHRSRLTDPKSNRTFDARATDLWYYSDDEGKTWTESLSWWALPMETRSGLQEPGVIELADGSIFSWSRTDQGAQYGFHSKDGGKTWTAPQPTTMKSPLSPASIKRIPGTAELLGVYNDHSGDFQFPEGKRTPLITALSKDEAKTWGNRKLIETDPDGWYCYTAIEFTKDAVLLAYCAGDSKVGRLNRLRIRRITLDWLHAP